MLKTTQVWNGPRHHQDNVVTDSTARKKIPLPPGYVVPRPQQPPPPKRNSMSGGETAPSGTAPRAASVQAVADEELLRASAYRQAMASLTEDEDKTTAFQVPEELLRRSRTGMPGAGFEAEDKSPDSGAVTAPPPPTPEAEEADEAAGIDLRLGVPGVPKNLDVHSFADGELEGDDERAHIEEQSGEYTRINRTGEISQLVTATELVESTQTKIRPKIEAKASGTGTALVWGLIGVASAVAAIVATLVAH